MDELQNQTPLPNSVSRAGTDLRGGEREGCAGFSTVTSQRSLQVTTVQRKILEGCFFYEATSLAPLFQKIMWLLGSQINLKRTSSQRHWKGGKYWWTSLLKGQVPKNRNFQELQLSYHEKANSIFWWKLLPPGAFDNYHFKYYKTSHWMNTTWMDFVFNSMVKSTTGMFHTSFNWIIHIWKFPLKNSLGLYAQNLNFQISQT